MTCGVSDKLWQAEARSEEIKRFTSDIKRITRRKFTAEENIRIVLEGFRRDTPIRDLCRREGIRPSTYHAWLKDFMEAGKERLQRDTTRDATRAEAGELKAGECEAKAAGGRAISPSTYSQKKGCTSSGIKGIERQTS